MKRALPVNNDTSGKRNRSDCIAASLQEVRFSNIPKYLHESDFYKSLNVEEGGVFHIPANHMKRNTTVRTVDDACSLLYTARFWGFCLSNVKWLKCIYRMAAAEGNLTCLMLLDEQLELSLERNSFWSHELTPIATENGHLDCLRFLHDKGVSLHNCAALAAAKGNVVCLEFIAQHCSLDVHESAVAYLAAIANNHFACVKRLHELNCPWTEQVSILAARKESLELLQYYYEHGGPWSYLTCQAAAVTGNLECLKFPHERGCALLPPDSNSLEMSYLVSIILKRKYWDCVVYLLAYNYPITPGAAAELATPQRNNLLQSAIEGGWIAPVEVAQQCAIRNNRKSLKCVLQSGCERSSLILVAAVRSGHLRCMKCAREFGCPWTTEVTVAAASAGHLDCLKYARDNGCYLNRQVLRTISQEGHPDIVRYLNSL